jgi:probable phosphoglycerate mutase
MARTVYLVRHGETKGNVERYAQGPLEPLNENGLRQASVVAERCQHLQFETIISSDMTRAHQTASAIAEVTTKPLETHALFREVSCSDVCTGPAAAASIESLQQEMPEQVENDEWFEKRGLESYRAVQTRAQDALQYLQAHTEQRLLVVSHGTFMKFLVAEIMLGTSASMEQLHLLRTRLRFSNTGVSQIDFSEEYNHWVVTHLNDTAHFAAQ